MRLLKVSIETRTAAFLYDDDGRSELARILRELAQALEDGGELPRYLYDVNGKRVGAAVTRD